MSTQHHLFVGITPGLEDLLEAEIVEALGHKPKVIHRVAGGVTLRAGTDSLWLLAHQLRLAEGIRVTLGHFQARDFSQLETRIARMPWAAFFPRGASPRVRATSRRSRMYHSVAIEERVARTIAARLDDGSKAESPTATTDDSTQPEAAQVHVRIVDDSVDVRIDAIGSPRLHQRGWRTHVGAAPMRETLAAACLRLADLAPDTVLWDPFCGSGTICIEYAAKVCGHPAPLEPNFAFTSWPTHDASAYATFLGQLSRPTPRPGIALGSDRAKREVQASKVNARASQLNEALSFQVADVNKLAAHQTQAEFIPQNAAVVTNLPYGHRTQGGPNLDETLDGFGRLLRQRADLDPVFVLTTHRGLNRQTGLRWQPLRAFENRGLHVTLFRLRR